MSSYAIPNVVLPHPRGDRVMDVYSHLLTERIVYIGTEIDDGVANVIVAQLLHLEAQGSEQEINLYINSPGGSLSASFAIYDAMQYVGSPVATTCIGQACATAALLLAAGEPGRRSALPHARVVLHQPSGQGHGAIPDLILQADEVIRLRAEAEQILSAHTGRPVEVLRKDTDRDRILTPAEAVEFGVIDRVVPYRKAAAGAPPTVRQPAGPGRTAEPALASAQGAPSPA